MSNNPNKPFSDGDILFVLCFFSQFFSLLFFRLLSYRYWNHNTKCDPDKVVIFFFLCIRAVSVFRSVCLVCKAHI